MEDVHHLLSTAYAQFSAKEAQQKLSEFDEITKSIPNPIDSTVLKLTRKILTKFGISMHCTLPKLYIKYLKLVDRSNTELLINLCNDALIIKDSLIGTESCEQLENCVRELLVFLIQQGTLDSQQSQVVQQLLETKPIVNYEEQMKDALDELENNFSVGINIIIEAFSSMSSVKDHFYYYSTQINPIIKALQSRKTIEVYSTTLKFMDIFLVPTNYLIKINDNQVNYQLTTLKYYANYEDVFYTSLSLLKILLQCDKYINENSIRIIHKLWNLYPKLRSHLHEYILINLKAIANGKSMDPRKRAAEFLFIIMHDKSVDGDFKGKLESEGLESLFEDESYDIIEPDPVELKDVKISAGFPICCDIHSGEKYCYYIEIEEENSILTWGFASEEYDISYTISRVDSVEQVVLYKGNRCNCDQVAIHGIEFIQHPGLYKFE